MELKKELPEIFEEFADARKNSFLAIKELKEEGIPVSVSFVPIFQGKSLTPWVPLLWDSVL